MLLQLLSVDQAQWEFGDKVLTLKLPCCQIPMSSLYTNNACESLLACD